MLKFNKDFVVQEYKFLNKFAERYGKIFFIKWKFT